jgi:hypothetical protein
MIELMICLLDIRYVFFSGGFVILSAPEIRMHLLLSKLTKVEAFVVCSKMF